MMNLGEVVGGHAPVRAEGPVHEALELHLGGFKVDAPKNRVFRIREFLPTDNYSCSFSLGLSISKCQEVIQARV